LKLINLKQIKRPISYYWSDWSLDLSPHNLSSLSFKNCGSW